ncbi:MAG: geranylgeranylglycerol-phosphate geranylgeranyltransferase [Bacteroidales bacterium]|nr:geranylgeranylglycerol-phosphate geranylgeranyltransferase [Bacteroidales bacterium]
MRFSIIKPILEVHNLKLQFTELNFFLLVMALVFVTAAGYVINDYFDTKTDLVNRPDKVIIGKKLNRRWAIKLHVLLNIIGIGLGTYVSFYIKKPILSLVFVFITTLLWFYSTSYKRQFFIGNIIVSLLTATVPLIVILFEIPLLKEQYGLIINEMPEIITYIILWGSAFSLFAFLLTLIREIVKDIEDFDGDIAFGRKTMPIVLGIANSKLIVVAFIITTLFSLLYFNFQFLNDKLTLVYFVIFLISPLLFLTYKIVSANTKKDYHLANVLLKFIMLSGILYALLANYFIVNHF